MRHSLNAENDAAAKMLEERGFRVIHPTDVTPTAKNVTTALGMVKMLMSEADVQKCRDLLRSVYYVLIDD